MSKLNARTRLRCSRCVRPISHCLCAHIPAIPNRTRVLILQHPDEAKHPLNTARLAVLGLQDADLLVAEHFPQLDGLLASAGPVFLLFPKSHNGDPETACDCPPEMVSDREPEKGALLIVPDGTWRKARKIIYMNPILNTLPRFSLPQGEPSEYKVRKAREWAAVSTIEAVVRALSIIEPEQDFQPLLKPFRVMVQQQIQAMDAAARG